jgi:C-terminal domain found in long catalases
VAPTIGGVEASDGTWIDAHEKIDGGPSTVFDAVAILASKEGAELLALEAPTARDFVSDAFVHMKFIGCSDAAISLVEGAGALKDEGVLPLNGSLDVDTFIKACRKLRFWPREPCILRRCSENRVLEAQGGRGRPHADQPSESSVRAAHNPGSSQATRPRRMP